MFKWKLSILTLTQALLLPDTVSSQTEEQKAQCPPQSQEKSPPPCRGAEGLSCVILCPDSVIPARKYNPPCPFSHRGPVYWPRVSSSVQSPKTCVLAEQVVIFTQSISGAHFHSAARARSWKAFKWQALLPRPAFSPGKRRHFKWNWIKLRRGGRWEQTTVARKDAGLNGLVVPLQIPFIWFMSFTFNESRGNPAWNARRSQFSGCIFGSWKFAVNNPDRDQVNFLCYIKYVFLLIFSFMHILV